MKIDVNKQLNCEVGHSEEEIKKHGLLYWFYESAENPEYNHKECIKCGLMIPIEDENDE